jgi:hypothetical protein
MFLQIARIICNLFFAMLSWLMLKKQRINGKDTTRMTFVIDRRTAQVIKQQCRETPRYLPDFIAELVRRGLEARAKA